MAGEIGEGGVGHEGRFGERTGINIISIVTSLFGLFFGGVDRNTKRAVEAIRSAQVSTANELSTFAVETGGWLARLVGFFRHVLPAVIVAALKKLDHAITGLADWLKRTLGPLLKFLKDVRKHILDFYAKWFRPIFDTIDVFRKVLQLAGFLGIEAAKKLDQKLAELERRMRLPIDALIRKVNEVIDVVDRVMTLDGFLQRYTLVRSLVLYQRDALRALLHPELADLDPAATTEMGKRPYPRATAEAYGRELRDFELHGGGAFAPQIVELSALLRGSALQAR